LVWDDIYAFTVVVCKRVYTLLCDLLAGCAKSLNDFNARVNGMLPSTPSTADNNYIADLLSLDTERLLEELESITNPPPLVDIEHVGASFRLTHQLADLTTDPKYTVTAEFTRGGYSQKVTADEYKYYEPTNKMATLNRTVEAVVPDLNTFTHNKYGPLFPLEHYEVASDNTRRRLLNDQYFDPQSVIRIIFAATYVKLREA